MVSVLEIHPKLWHLNATLFSEKRETFFEGYEVFMGQANHNPLLQENEKTRGKMCPEEGKGGV